jgi:hypothetical protein
VNDAIAAGARAAVRRTENLEQALQRDWPARAQVRAREPDKRYAALPQLVAGAFAPAGARELERLALACKLLHDAALLRTAGATEELAAVRASAAQLEACTVLAELFGGAAPLWDALRALERAHAHALVEEEAYRSGRRALAELTGPEALALARAPELAQRIAIVGVGLLARDDRPVEALLRCADRCDEARHLVSGLRTWKADLAARRPTYVVARLSSAGGGGDDRAFAARLYAGGIAAETVALAEDACAEALRALAGSAGIPAWRRTVGALAQRVAAYRGALAPAALARAAT